MHIYKYIQECNLRSSVANTSLFLPPPTGWITSKTIHKPILGPLLYGTWFACLTVKFSCRSVQQEQELVFLLMWNDEQTKVSSLFIIDKREFPSNADLTKRCHSLMQLRRKIHCSNDRYLAVQSNQCKSISASLQVTSAGPDYNLDWTFKLDANAVKWLIQSLVT